MSARTKTRRTVLRALIAALQNGELRRDVAAQQIGTSPRCICRCFFELGDLVSVVRREKVTRGPTKPVYRLVADAAAVKQFLAEIGPKVRQPVVPVQKPAADPFALPAGFFGGRASSLANLTSEGSAHVA
jgi:hypothetical protein